MSLLAQSLKRVSSSASSACKLKFVAVKVIQPVVQVVLWHKHGIVKLNVNVDGTTLILAVHVVVLLS